MALRNPEAASSAPGGTRGGRGCSKSSPWLLALGVDPKAPNRVLGLLGEGSGFGG